MALTLPSEREIVIMREFNAPRRRVFEAWTDPQQVKQWYGCGELHLVSCEIDLRIGGDISLRAARTRRRRAYDDGPSISKSWRPDRLVYTERYVSGQFESDEAFVTVTLVERDGRTKLTSTVLHKNAANRDMHLNSGVEKGARLTLDRLEQLLWTMD